ncbi:Holliday junction branch migration protein RuvA [Isoalcanivorax beigongshangi]|uniref:Holliday junction branch migration complex subunit RuvA n=1 Tax=Isoalcanivorax beigongshangi TaxID=3238810 RepID=A0ABV4AKM0_9GAMM
MIGRLRGTLLEVRAPWLLLEAGGVGYEVEAPMTAFYDAPAVGSEWVLYTHLVVREDAQLLYGFVDRFERELFRELIKVSGVGPKTALGMLSGIEAERLVQCIDSQDTAALMRVPGIGKKTAERLVIEMGDRLGRLEGTPRALPGRVAPVLAPADAARSDAAAALEALGYRAKDADAALRKATADLSDDDIAALDSAELIRRTLKQLAR